MTKQKLPKEDKEYKLSLKKMWIALGCLFPVLIAVTYVFGAVLKLDEWLVIFINVVLGGFVCLIIYFIFDRIEKKRKLNELLNDDKDKFDPFKD